MAVYTTTQAGNLSANATWVGGSAPPSAAGHQLVVAHALTVDTSWEGGPSVCTTQQSRPTMTATGSGGSLPNGTYRGLIVAVGTTGESTPSGESSATISAGQVVRFTLPALPAGATSWNVYLSQAGGAAFSERRYATGQAAGTFDCSSANWEDGTVAFGSAATQPNGDAIRATALVTINDGVTLTLKGDFTHTAGITIGQASTGDATLVFDCSGSPSGAAIYHIIFGNYTTAGTGVLTMRGTSGHWSVIKRKTASDHCSILPSSQFATNGNVKLDLSWAKFVGLNDGANLAINAIQATASWNQTLTDVIFDADCGIMIYTNTPATSGWIETRVSYRQTAGQIVGARTNCVAYKVSADVTTGTRSCTNCSYEVLPPALSNGGATYTSCYFHDIWDYVTGGSGGSATSDSTMTNCFCRKSISGTDTGSLGGQSSGNYLYIDIVTEGGTDSNPHGLSPTAISTARNHDNWTAEYNGTDNTGDIWKSPTGTGTVRIRNYLEVPNASGQKTGTSFTFFNNSPSGYRLEMLHCTYLGGPYSLSTSEGGAMSAGLIALHKSNLIYYPDRTMTNRYAIMKSTADGQNDVTDPASPANVDYNAGWNLLDVTGNWVGAYSWYNTKFSSQPGINDVDLGDTGADPSSAGPQFVDWTRNFKAWCVAVLSASGTDAQKISTGLNALKAIADTTSANHVGGLAMTDPATWVRAGFAPQNTSLRNAGHDGVTIGAIEGVFAGGVFPNFIDNQLAGYMQELGGM